MKDFKKLREREVIATAKLKGDIKYKAVAIRDFRRTAIILNIEEFEEMQKVMKRIKLP